MEEPKTVIELKEEFYNKLPHKKIEINWNKKPIEMPLFLSFITVPVERSYDHPGSDMLWTRLYNKDYNLIIRGGIVGGIEYLDCLQFGDKLSNPYNNYVNPLFLRPILSEDGRHFFLNYYKDDIEKVISRYENSISHLEKQLIKEKSNLNKVLNEVTMLKQRQQQP